MLKRNIATEDKINISVKRLEKEYILDQCNKTIGKREEEKAESLDLIGRLNVTQTTPIEF